MSTPASRFDRRLLAPMMLGSLLNPINSSMIAVALIPIGISLGAPPSQTAWLVSALYLATAIGQPVVGRLVDVYGPRRLFLIGTTLTGVAGVLGLLAPNLGVLIVARVVLGVGTCAGYPAAMYLIRSEADRTGEKSPSGVLTALAVSSQTIAVIGPTLGGVLIGVGGWRATFAVNLPLAVIAFALGALRLPRTVVDRDKARDAIDVAGIGLFAAMLTALLLFLMEPHLDYWYLLPLTVAFGVVFTLRELRAREPFLDVRVLAGNGPLLRTFARNFFAYVTSYAFLYGFAQWLEDGRGMSATGAGLMLLPLSLTAIAVSTLTGRRPQIRAKLVVGSIALIAACLLLLVLRTSSPLWLLLLACLVAGIPQGLNSLANQNALYHQAEPERMGSSAGLLRTFMYVGAMVAGAATAAAYGDFADTRGLHELALFMLVTAAILLLAGVLDRSLSRVGAPAGERPRELAKR